MKIQIHSYIDTGKIQLERIALKVISDCNLKFYCLHQSDALDGGGFFHLPKHSYWFTPQEVKAGDWVVLYTNSGINSTKKNEDGSTSYFYYWGLDNVFFKNPTDIIVLAEIDSWQMKKNE